MVSIMLPVVVSRFCSATGTAIMAMDFKNIRQLNFSFVIAFRSLAAFCKAPFLVI